MEKVIEAIDKALAGKYTAKSDLVNWEAYPRKGSKIGKWWSRSICYARAMDHNLSDLEVHCLPYPTQVEGQGLSAADYRLFFRLCKKEGLVPPKARAGCLNGHNYLVLPRSRWDRHTLYTALCLYRQTDIKPLEIARCLSLWRELSPQGTTFIQCLHHLAATTVIQSGHYFIAFGSTPYGERSLPATDLATGQALAHFAQLPWKERHKLVLHPKRPQEGGWNARQQGYTTAMFSKQLFPKFRSVTIPRVEEILNPKYAPFYQSPEFKS